MQLGLRLSFGTDFFLNRPCNGLILASYTKSESNQNKKYEKRLSTTVNDYRVFKNNYVLFGYKGKFRPGF